MSVYDKSSWRKIPRKGECALSLLLGGPCSPGPLHLHHLTPVSEGGDESALVLCCNAHHQRLHGARRRSERRWKRCSHKHPYAEGRRACEERLNRLAA